MLPHKLTTLNLQQLKEKPVTCERLSLSDDSQVSSCSNSQTRHRTPAFSCASVGSSIHRVLRRAGVTLQRARSNMAAIFATAKALARHLVFISVDVTPSYMFSFSQSYPHHACLAVLSDRTVEWKFSFSVYNTTFCPFFNSLSKLVSILRYSCL